MGMTIENIDYGSVELADGRFRDELIAFAGAATLKKGTILARRAVALAVVASAITGTGTGTVTAASVVPGATVPLPGQYTLRCTAAVADGGVFRLEDPNGAVVASDLRLTVGSGAATAFEAAGLAFTITDGGTNFALGDTATLTVAADGKLVPFDPAGAGGAQVPHSVLTYPVTSAGVGNVAARVLVAGDVKKERLVIHADGDGDNVTSAVVDQLRHVGITAVNVNQLGKYDTQD